MGRLGYVLHKICLERSSAFIGIKPRNHVSLKVLLQYCTVHPEPFS